MPAPPEETHVFRLRGVVFERLKRLKGRLLVEGVPPIKKMDDSKGELTISGVIDIALALAEEALSKRKGRKR